MNLTEGIPIYDLANFRTIHRTENGEDFGYNLFKNSILEDFELFSTDGQNTEIGPLKTDFFYIGLNLTGSANIELNHFAHKHSPNTIFFKLIISTFMAKEKMEFAPPLQILLRDNGLLERNFSRG